MELCCVELCRVELCRVELCRVELCRVELCYVSGCPGHDGDVAGLGVRGLHVEGAQEVVQALDALHDAVPVAVLHGEDDGVEQHHGNGGRVEHVPLTARGRQHDVRNWGQDLEAVRDDDELAAHPGGVDEELAQLLGGLVELEDDDDIVRAQAHEVLRYVALVLAAQVGDLGAEAAQAAAHELREDGGVAAAEDEGAVSVDDDVRRQIELALLHRLGDFLDGGDLIGDELAQDGAVMGDLDMFHNGFSGGGDEVIVHVAQVGAQFQKALVAEFLRGAGHGRRMNPGAGGDVFAAPECGLSWVGEQNLHDGEVRLV